MAIKEIVEGLLLAKKAYDAVSDIREKNKLEAKEARDITRLLSGSVSTAKRVSLRELEKGENTYNEGVLTDGVLFADIRLLMNKCTNRESYELLKKAMERGFTHIIAKIYGGKMTGEIEWIQDTSTTPDPKVIDILGSEEYSNN